MDTTSALRQIPRRFSPERLRQAMSEADFSSADALALATGLSRATIYNALGSHCVPHSNSLVMFSSILSKTLDFFFEEIIHE